MKNKMIDVGVIRQKLIDNVIEVDSLLEQREEFEKFGQYLLYLRTTKHMAFDDAMIGIVRDFLYVCQDVYAYSQTGGMLINDTLYHELQSLYMDITESDGIYKADYIQSISSWGFRKHEAPFMVGTISNKIYTVDKLVTELEKKKRLGYHMLHYAPKFDGVSASVGVKNGEITYAMTRNDGIQGQDITELIRRSNLSKQVFTKDTLDGHYKTELVVSTEDYNSLQKIKQYANRRSAASAIVSTPSNIDLAEFIQPIPLAWVNFEGTAMRYLAREYVPVKYDPHNMELEYVYRVIESILHQIRQPSYPFRVDGVVIFPCCTDDDTPNLVDLMTHCIAYKVNTQETLTHVEDIIMSIGRTGKAKPVAQVEPCDLNETVCTNAALGSYDIFRSLHLHKGEEVIIFSAGDVIPQLRLPDDGRNYPKGADVIIPDMHCSFCGEELQFKRDGGSDVYCVNPECPRVRSGIITNFLDKLEVAEGFRDETFYKLVETGIVTSIKSLFTLDKKRAGIAELIGPINADKLIDGMKELKTKKFEVSTVIGSCGIEGIGRRKCQTIFSEYDLDYLMSLSNEMLYRKLMSLYGVAGTTAKIMTEWLTTNRALIKFLQTEMNIEDDPITYGNVVFTGFRNKEYHEPFKRAGFPVVDSVNKDTVVVFSVGNQETGNSKKARKKGIPIIHFGLIDTVLARLDEIGKQVRKEDSFNKDDLVEIVRSDILSL